MLSPLTDAGTFLVYGIGASFFAGALSLLILAIKYGPERHGSNRHEPVGPTGSGSASK